MTTSWEHPRPGWTERDPTDATDAVDALLADLVTACSAGDPVEVRSVGFCSIAETGTLVDAAGRPRTRLLAWHDPRGAEQAAALPPDVANALPARTGLAVGPVATAAKLLWMRDVGGVVLGGLQWLSLPELVCHHLGAPAVAERSMLGRTALADVHTGGLFTPLLDVLGVGEELVPPRVAAGAALGRVRADHPVAPLRGAVLTVAGHDHLVAAAALGAGAPGHLCDSVGTAEALVLAVPAPPPPDALATLVARGISAYPHVVDGTTCVLGALRTGLVLAHAADALGASTTAERFALDARCAGVSPAPVTVTGLAMGAGDVDTTWPPGTPDTGAWLGVLAATRAVVLEEVEAVRAAGLDLEDAVVTGGWAHLPTVLASRTGILARTTHVTLEEPGARGAALFGRWAATRHPDGSEPTAHQAPPAGWFPDTSA